MIPPRTTIPARDDHLFHNAPANISFLGDEHVQKQYLPRGFPIHQWNTMLRRYSTYWRWFTGEYLEQTLGTTDSGEVIYKFPLKINVVRNFARKHASVLLGEDTGDTGLPLVRTTARPRFPLDGGEPSEIDKRCAKFIANLCDIVWEQSEGRAIQTEAAITSQFLGGSVFQVSYVPHMKHLAVPIRVNRVTPDYFLPVWGNKDYWNLLEAYVIYRIPAAQAEAQYGVKVKGTYGIYTEHWKRDTYSIKIDGKPLTDKLGGEYLNRDNPFEAVPFVYIPHIREGGFYGSSHIEDLKGLLLEFNARLTDFGDAVQDVSHPERYGRNLTSNPRPKKISENVSLIDIGHESPTHKHPPDIFREQGVQLTPEISRLSEVLWEQILREGNMSRVAFGEDEGSQRSALTLAFRMWPLTSHARTERTNWTVGLNIIAKLIIRLFKKLDTSQYQGIEDILPERWESMFRIGQDWQPQIPRDREQMVNELVLRKQSGTLSTRESLNKFGDIENIDDELKEIERDLKMASEVAAEQQAQESLDSPVASPGSSEE